MKGGIPDCGMKSASAIYPGEGGYENREKMKSTQTPAITCSYTVYPSCLYCTYPQPHVTIRDLLEKYLVLHVISCRKGTFMTCILIRVIIIIIIIIIIRLIIKANLVKHCWRCKQTSPQRCLLSGMQTHFQNS